MIAPKLRFSEFKDEWLDYSINDFAETVTSGSRDWAKYYSKSGDKFIRMTNLIRNGIYLNLDDLKFVNLPIDSNEGKRTSLQHGDILVSITAELGKIGWIPNDLGTAYINQHTALIRTNDKIDSKFLAYLLSTEKYNNQINGLNDSGAKAGLNLSTLRNFKFIASQNKKEQTKIAEFLSAVDDKISQLSRQLELLNQYKKGVMQKIFSQEIRFKNDNGEDFGEWEEVKFSDIFIEIKDKVGNKNIETYSITAGKGFVSQSEKFGRNISGRQNENYIVLDDNDFSYNKGNSKTYKFGCVYLNNTGQLIAVPNVFISFRAKKNNIAHNFYAKLFEHHYLDKYLRQLISSSARMDGLLNISKEGFFEISLPFPSKPEQEKIAEFLTAIDERIDHTTAQLTHTKQWKKGLLQQMFV